MTYSSERGNVSVVDFHLHLLRNDTGVLYLANLWHNRTVKCFIKPRWKVRVGYAERRGRWEIHANCSSKPESKRQLRSHVFRWRDNFTLNLRGTGCECVCWTVVIHIRVLWLVVVIMLINVQIPWKAEISWPAQCLPAYQERFCSM